MKFIFNLMIKFKLKCLLKNKVNYIKSNIYHFYSKLIKLIHFLEILDIMECGENFEQKVKCKKILEVKEPIKWIFIREIILNFCF